VAHVAGCRSIRRGITTLNGSPGALDRGGRRPAASQAALPAGLVPPGGRFLGQASVTQGLGRSAMLSKGGSVALKRKPGLSPSHWSTAEHNKPGIDSCWYARIARQLHLHRLPPHRSRALPCYRWRAEQHQTARGYQTTDLVLHLNPIPSPRPLSPDGARLAIRVVFLGYRKRR